MYGKTVNKTLKKGGFIKRAKEKFGDAFSYKKSVYVNKNTLVVVTCKIHGDFKILPDNFLRSNTGCYYCGKKVDITEFIAKAKEVHGDEYEYHRVNLVNTNTPVEIICRKHGSFWQVPYLHYGRKTKCPTCSRENDRLNVNSFISKSKTIHGDKYVYDKVIYETNKSLVVITCPIHGDFTQSARSHLNGNGCKQCFLDNNKLGVENFIINSKAVHGDKYDYSEVVYSGNKKPVKIICPEHGAFYKKPNAHVSSKSGCTKCIESKGECRIRIFLEKHGIRYLKEYKVEPYLYRYDFFLPDYNIFIEFHGQQHFKPIEMFGGEKALAKVKENDSVKKLIVRALGAYLITLTYLQTKDDTLEKVLVSALKRHYHYWFIINDKLEVYKGIIDVCKTYNLPPDTNTVSLLSKLNEKINNLKVLF